MAPRKKKADLKPSPPLTRAGSLAERLRDNHEGAPVYTAADMMKMWRYIDFHNPLMQIPSISLEWLLGCRGLLAGRIMQLRATYSKGKSSLMYLIYAAAQMLSDAFCYHVETEGAGSPPDYIASFGCDPENLVVDEMASLEECFARLDEVVAEIRGGFGGSKNKEGRTIKTKFVNPLDEAMAAPIVAGIDSLSALGLADYVDEDVADMTGTPALASHSRKVRDYLRRRVARFKQTQTLLMLTSHETAKIQSGRKSFGGPQKSALAQEAIGIHATYILDLAAKTWMNKDRGERYGDIITLTTSKNKLSPKGRVLDLYLHWNHGFDLVTTDTEFLLHHQASPLREVTRRIGGRAPGIKCEPLGDGTFHTDEEFIRAFYANEQLLQACRVALRIRGFGFDFEKKYIPSPEEIEDNKNSEESDIDGVEGSPETVQESTDAGGSKD